MSIIRKISDSVTLDQVYPVGSIYMSVNTTNPANLFGGTWQRIEGKFLLGATGDTVSTGTNIQMNASVGPGGQGGEAAHTLATSEIPAHNHPVGYRNISDQSGSTSRRHGPYGQSDSNTGNINSGNNSGGGGSHNNMPPFLAVCIWKRTA